MTQRLAIPTTGRDAASVLEDARAYIADDADYKNGRTWSMVYWPGEEHHHLTEAANNLCLAQNALNPYAFKGLKRMETEVVQMCAGLLNGPPTTVGTMTSGGTESLLLVVKTYRDLARARWPWIRRPVIVAPKTIHPAFDKGAHLFGVRLRKVPVDADGKVDPHAVRRAICRNTVLVAASAPQYVTGVVDPIPAIASIARERRIPMHVDACFGGFILPWLERLGVRMPVWDFRVHGVTSVSADLHKYGYAPKGASVLLFREMRHLRHQFFASTDWPGGIYISPGLPGTRPGGPIAAAWASLLGMGEDGYLERAKGAWEAAEALRAGIRTIPGLRVLGEPMSTIVTWTSAEVDVYAVADQLQAKGWGVDRQQHPSSVHCTCNASNLPSVPLYLDDLREAVAHVRAHPELAREGDAAVYGLLARVPVRGMVKSGVLDVMEKMYAPDGGTPDLDGDDPVQRWATRALDAVDRVKGALRRGR
ncbi:MAG: aspartate aminotransferase family protein [Myxococcales bacterium]|nr:aspartate aminotransferase family protein [Myxococcales bacterium]